MSVAPGKTSGAHTIQTQGRDHRRQPHVVGTEPMARLPRAQAGLGIANGQKPTVDCDRLSRIGFTTPRDGLARCNPCVFQPMLMRRKLRNGGLPAEGFVELTPRPRRLLSERLRLLRRRGATQRVGSEGMPELVGRVR